MSRHNPNKIKEKHAYSIKETANALNVHIRTVQSWRKQGLQVIDADTKPYLIYGKELKRFLKNQSAKHTLTLKAGEFLCPKCQRPRFSVKTALRITLTNKRLGPTSMQALIKGRCEICHTVLTLFSSDKKLKEMSDKGMLSQELESLITGDGDNCLNADIKGGK